MVVIQEKLEIFFNYQTKFLCGVEVGCQCDQITAAGQLQSGQTI